MAESYLEKAIVKLAKQLNAYDEASLMSLWEKYAEQVRRFEPTKRWEESVLVFNMIQSMRFKNQLFNYNWAQSREPEPDQHTDLAALTAPERPRRNGATQEPGLKAEGLRFVEQNEDGKDKPKGKILKLTPRDGE
ncbi:hypothetical protein [Salidesulfovibrio onnuriiensis]|uniref:hypothetical protein n=1 Tax=Salidesulfovibrio onnuriiensis TaxID=2583823 RepID=UPI0011C986B7|nr:hypothetical protein [Salidesulfovibrio onnuriiensis]